MSYDSGLHIRLYFQMKSPFTSHELGALKQSFLGRRKIKKGSTARTINLYEIVRYADFVAGIGGHYCGIISTKGVKFYEMLDTYVQIKAQ